MRTTPGSGLVGLVREAALVELGIEEHRSPVVDHLQLRSLGERVEALKHAHHGQRWLEAPHVHGERAADSAWLARGRCRGLGGRLSIEPDRPVVGGLPLRPVREAPSPEDIIEREGLERRAEHEHFLVAQRLDGGHDAREGLHAPPDVVAYVHVHGAAGREQGRACCRGAGIGRALRRSTRRLHVADLAADGCQQIIGGDAGHARCLLDRHARRHDFSQEPEAELLEVRVVAGQKVHQLRVLLEEPGDGHAARDHGAAATGSSRARNNSSREIPAAAAAS